MQPLSTSPRALAGVLLGAMLAASVGHGFFAVVPEWTAGLAAWGAAALLWNRLSAGQQRQCTLLIVVGLAGVVIGTAGGVEVQLSRLLDENQAILALIAGVSFVHMASIGGPAPTREGPRGPGAFLRTLLGLNLLSAAINITALMLVSEHVSRIRPLGRLEAGAFSRTFSLAVLYSPFIGGMALALNLAPGASLAGVAAIGIGLAICGITFTVLTASWRDPEALAAFPGYPLRAEVLWLPGALAAAVFAVHHYRPQVPVLSVIALLAPVIAWMDVARRIGPGRAASRAIEHVGGRLPGMSGELLLFLSAGVLAVGLSSAFAAAGIGLPETRFHALGASLALLLVIVLAAAGLHPIISLTALIPLLEPLFLTQEGTVMLFVAGWSIGCAVCPYSGTNLILQARHGFSPWRFPAWNAGYAAFMWLLASIALMFEAGLG